MGGLNRIRQDFSRELEKQLRKIESLPSQFQQLGEEERSEREEFERRVMEESAREFQTITDLQEELSEGTDFSAIIELTREIRERRT